MADGSVIFDTKLDSSGLRTGLAKMASIAAKGVAATVVALGGLSVAAIKVGSDFEAQMSRVNAISGATQEEFAELTELAKKLGAETAFSASEAAAGMENLASAGFDANQIMKAMPGLLDLAAVSGGDVAAASEVAASAINAFGLEAVEAGHVADVFAQAAAATNAETLDMGEAMKYVAPVAKSMGLTLEETAAAIGIMSDAGVKGSQAGTALRGALSRLAKPTKNMKEKMDELGLSYYDAEGKMIPLSAQVSMLKEKFEGLSQEEQNNALVTLYGQEALSGMLALIEAGPEKLDSLTESFENSAGAAQNMAKIMQDNLQGDIEALGGSAETLAITFTERLNEPLREMVQLADEYIQQLQEALSKDGFDGLIDAVADVLSEALTKARDAIIAATPKIIDAASRLISNLLSSLRENSSKLVSSTMSVLDALVDCVINIAPEFLDTAIAIVEDMGNALGDALPKLLPKIVRGFTDLITKFASKGIPVVIKAVSKIISGVAKAIGTSIPIIVDSLDEILEAVIDGLMASIPDLISAVGNVAYTVITEVLNPVNIGMTLWNTLDGIIDGISSGIDSLFSGIFSLFTDSWEEEAATLSEEALEIADNLAETFGSGIERATAYMDSISSAGTIFEDFNKNILFSAEKEREIAAEMESVQGEITAIAEVASEERRSLTSTEIERLDELFAKMRELTEQELELQKAYGEVATTQAEALVSTYDGTVEGFTASAQKYLNSAEEAKNKVIALAEEQYTTELVLLQKRLETDSTYTNEQYQADIKAALERKDSVVQAAQAECAETYAVISQGLADRAKLNGDSFTAVNKYNKQIEEENNRHNKELKKIGDEHHRASTEAYIAFMTSGYKNYADYYSAIDIATREYNEKREELEKEHTAKSVDLQESLLRESNRVYNEQNSVHMAMYLAMLSQAKLYGADITEEQNLIVKNILAAYDNLPDDAKTKFEEVGQGMLDGLSAKEDELFTSASNLAEGFIGRIGHLFDINSPSRVMRKMFGYVMEGGILGIDDEEDAMLSKAAKAAKGTRDCFDEYLSDLNYEVGASMVARMQKTVDESHNVVRNVANARSDDYFSDYDNDTNSNEDKSDDNPKMIHGDVILDGKKVGKVITPYVSKELAWEGK